MLSVVVLQTTLSCMLCLCFRFGCGTLLSNMITDDVVVALPLGEKKKRETLPLTLYVSTLGVAQCALPRNLGEAP